jgi:hypothetical protein
MARRFFIALILCTLAALVCWILLPRLGTNLPWFVPLLAYVPMLLTGLAAWLNAKTPPDEDHDAEPVENDDNP